MDTISHEMRDFCARLNRLAPGRYWLAHDGLGGRVQRLIDVVRLGPGDLWDGTSYREGVYWIDGRRLEPIASLALQPRAVVEPVAPGTVMSEAPDHDARHRTPRREAG